MKEKVATRMAAHDRMKITWRLKEVCILLTSLRTLISRQWTPAEVKVWFNLSVFSYSTFHHK
ncbi:hypothetical protein EYF80_040591 [Liparis tanakae]|uniref:Uncharacterized protein n=1 Tax=Liparis tanakae TaxID=230148 RepID=A0A4Z2G849_9TELE|nr:hypothetical protein EYF80_040591 [Liparis tanakae]